MVHRLKRFGAALGLAALLSSPAAAIDDFPARVQTETRAAEVAPAPYSIPAHIPVTSIPTPVTKVPPRFIVGGNFDDHVCRLPETWCEEPSNLLAELKTIGIRGVRYAINWHVINPAPGVYDWSRADEFMKQAKDADAYVYGNIWGAPAWVTGGKGWWEGMHCNVLAYPELDPKNYKTNPATGESMWGFRYDLDECVNPPPLNLEEYKKFISLVVKRYPQMRELSLFNEPENGDSWPPGFQYRHDGVYKIMEYLIKTVAVAGNEAARQAALDRGVPIHMIGPETNKPDFLEAVFQHEAELVAQGVPRVLDGWSIHLYDDLEHYPANVLKAFDADFVPVLKKYANGRMGRVGETGYTPFYDKFNAAVSLARQSELITGTWGDNYQDYAHATSSAIPSWPMWTPGTAPIMLKENMFDEILKRREWFTGVYIYRLYENDCNWSSDMAIMCGNIKDKNVWSSQSNVVNQKRNVWFGIEDFVVRHGLNKQP